MKAKLIIILFAFLLGYDQCEPETPVTELEKLPLATQEGKNTFGCLINGKAWVTKTSIDDYAFYQNMILGIGSSVRNQTQSQMMLFTIADRVTAGSTYDLTDNTRSIAQFSWQPLTGDCRYDPESVLAGNLTISKFDPVNLIVSGSFEFITHTPACDTVRVTNGRFDFTYAN